MPGKNDTGDTLRKSGTEGPIQKEHLDLFFSFTYPIHSTIIF